MSAQKHVAAYWTADGARYEKGGLVDPWFCALLIFIAGAAGGVINALVTDNGFTLPRKVSTIWCPGFLSNVMVGAFSAFASWSFYGSGAAVELARGGERNQISLTFSALAGAFLVGVAGSRWLTNEVDKRLLKETVREATKRNMPAEEADKIVDESPRKALQHVVNAHPH